MDNEDKVSGNKEIFKAVQDGNLSLFKLHFQKSDLINLSIDVDVLLSPQEKQESFHSLVTMKFNIIHFIIVSREEEILNFLLNKSSKEDLEVVLKGTVDIKDEPFKDYFGNEEKYAEEDAWINGATCLHLAARLTSKALHILLTSNSSKETCKELVNNRTKLWNMTPLHVCANSTTSISTR